MTSRRPDTPADGIVRVRFRGGALSGAVLDLPEHLSDAEPGRIVVTDGGIVFDRHARHAVVEARVVELPTRARVRTLAPRRPLL